VPPSSSDPPPVGDSEDEPSASEDILPEEWPSLPGIAALERAGKSTSPPPKRNSDVDPVAARGSQPPPTHERARLSINRDTLKWFAAALAVMTATALATFFLAPRESQHGAEMVVEVPRAATAASISPSEKPGPDPDASSPTAAPQSPPQAQRPGVTIEVETSHVNVTLGRKGTRHGRKRLTGPWPMQVEVEQDGDWDILAYRAGHKPKVYPIELDERGRQTIVIDLAIDPSRWHRDKDIYE
jgi:hypothetical protein